MRNEKILRKTKSAFSPTGMALHARPDSVAGKNRTLLFKAAYRDCDCRSGHCDRFSNRLSHLRLQTPHPVLGGISGNEKKIRERSASCSI